MGGRGSKGRYVERDVEITRNMHFNELPAPQATPKKEKVPSRDEREGREFLKLVTDEKYEEAMAWRSEKKGRTGLEVMLGCSKFGPIYVKHVTEAEAMNVRELVDLNEACDMLLRRKRYLTLAEILRQMTGEEMMRMDKSGRNVAHKLASGPDDTADVPRMKACMEIVLEKTWEEGVMYVAEDREDGETVLQIMAKSDMPVLLELVLQRGDDADYLLEVDDKGRTYVHLLAANRNYVASLSGYHSDQVDWLSSRLMEEEDDDGEVPLMTFMRTVQDVEWQGCHEAGWRRALMSFLMRTPSSVFSRPFPGSKKGTLLHCMMRVRLMHKDFVNVVEYVIKAMDAGMADWQDDSGETAAHVAARSLCCPEAVIHLTRALSPEGLNLPNVDGDTVLHVIVEEYEKARSAPRDPRAQLLSQCDPRLDTVAAMVSQFRRRAPCIFKAHDAKGRTAFELAVERGYDDLASRLKITHAKKADVGE